MKKILFTLVTLILIVSLVFLVACTNNNNNESVSIKIVAPDGATALALTSFIDNNKLDEKTSIETSIVSASALGAEAVKADLAIVPVNLAAKMFNNNADIKVISTITNGNLYLMSSINKENFSLNDLKGKMLYTIGQGAVPSMILLSLLKLNNIEYEISDEVIEGKVAIKYCADGPALLPFLVAAAKNSKEVYGMLADPAVTNAKNSGKAFEVLDIQKAYQEATNSEVYGFAQAVLIAKSAIANNEELVTKIIKRLNENDEFVALNAQKSYEIISGKFTETSLPKTISNEIVKRCNLKALRAKENKEYIKTTLDSIFAINANAIGSVPQLDSGFYA